MGKKLSEPLENSIRPVKHKVTKSHSSKKPARANNSPIVTKLEVDLDADLSYPHQNSSKRTVYVNRLVRNL